MKTIAIVLIVLSFGTSLEWAEARRARRRKGKQVIEKALKVRGQTRTLSMLLVLKNRKEKIKFIKVRRKYREEILGTEY